MSLVLILLSIAVQIEDLTFEGENDFGAKRSIVQRMGYELKVNL